MGWNERLRADLEYIPFNGIPKSIWSEHKKAIGDFIGFDFLKSILLGDDAAILLSFLDEVHKKDLAPDPFLTPLILDGNYHAKLKQKILNIDGKYPSLKAAKTLKFSTPTLHDPPERDRKKLKILTSELEAVGKEWMENGGSPFDMLIAQKGETVFHGSFGTDGMAHLLLKQLARLHPLLNYSRVYFLLNMWNKELLESMTLSENT